MRGRRGHTRGVLKEFPHVKQEHSGGRRRWFEDELVELVVWYRENGAIDGFQICYPGSDQRERALTWREGAGFSHAAVDAGDERPDKNLTPVLVADGAVPWAALIADFDTRSRELEAPLREFVMRHLWRGGA